MFRPLSNPRKQIPEEACIALLTSEKRGILSVLGDGGYPYGMPMNHFYNPEDGCIYFHCGRSGHRLDAIGRHEKVSFCVCEQGRPIEGHWALTVRSVIVFGRMEIIDDPERVIPIVTRLSHKFTRDEAFLQGEIRSYGPETILLRLVPQQICGKQITES